MSPKKDRSHYKNNRLQQLRGFCYAVQTGSISRAAEKMSLSQPSVSLQIQALERELDVVLFERRGPKIRVTPEGESLFTLALPLLNGIDQLPESFTATRNNLDSGEVHITAGESTFLYLLPDVLLRFGQEYPGINIRFHNAPGKEGLQFMRDDTVDFAVGSFRTTPDDMSYQPIYAFDQMLIAPAGHPLSELGNIALKDISQYGFILPPRHLNTQNMVELAFQQHDLNLNVRLEAGGWEVIKRYVEKGVGISIVSGICLNDGDDLFSCSLAEHFPQRTYGVIMRRGKFLSPQARKFIEFIDPGFFGATKKIDDNN